MSSKAPYEVFKRKDSANWWMRFSLPNQGQIRLPLKTSDHEEALRKAGTEYQRAVFQAEHDLLPGKMSFDKVALGFLDSIKAEPTNKKAHATWVSHKGVIDRYLIPYFGKTPIAGLTEPKLYAFVDWRRTFWTKGPGKDLKFIQYERGGRKLMTPARHEEPKLSTLRREAVTLRAVFNFAARKGFINRGAIPKLSLEKEETNKRPSFTNAEINALLTIAEQRIAEMSDHPKLRYERVVLFCFVAIAVDTGMRPTELYNLNWANIVGFAEERTKPLAQRRIRIQAYGKGFQPRELVPNVGVFGAFENLWELYVQQHGKAPADDDAVFRNIEGDRLGSIKNSLNQLLEAAKLKQDAFGRARTAYSFRHTYASNQIRKGTDVYTLAINMRTSVRMIETYYSDVLPADLAKQLEGSFD